MDEPNKERLHRLVDNAIHDSVTADLLTKKKGGIASLWLHDRPLWSYLDNREQPNFIFYANSTTPEFLGPNAPEEISRSRPYKVMHLITDKRWIMVGGNRAGDDARKFPLDKIGAVNFETESGLSKRVSNRKFVFETSAGDIWCKVPIANDFSYEDLEELSYYLVETADAERHGVATDPDDAGYTVDGIDSLEADRETIAVLLDEVPVEAEMEANEIVTKAETAEELVTELNGLIEEYETKNQSVDDLVENSDSLDGLRQSVESPLEQWQRRAEEQLSEARTTVRDADPEEVGNWSQGIGKTFLPLAVAAPYSTSILLAGALGTGGVIGVHASGRNDTILDGIDPQELARHAQAMSQKGSDLEHINGEAVGAILGASQYLGQTMPSEEYAKWVVEADVESMLEGAELGAAFAQKQAGNGTRRQGALAGATLGLADSYTTESKSAVRETVDEDVYKEYLESLAQEGISLPD